MRWGNPLPLVDSFSNLGTDKNNSQKESPCMKLIKDAVVANQRSQTLSYIALGISIVALLTALTVIGARNAR